jgi:hypothetical protein
MLPLRSFDDNAAHDRSSVADLNKGSVLSGILPEVEHEATTVAEVSGDLLRGAAEKVIDEPSTVLKDFVIGAATGAAVTFLPALLVPAVLYGACQLYQNRSRILNAGKQFYIDVAIINDRSHQGGEEIASAQRSLKGFGGAGAEIAAGIIGGVAGSMAMQAAIAARAALPEVQVAQAERNVIGVQSQTGADHIKYTSSGLVDENGLFDDFHYRPINHSRVLDFKDTWQLEGTKAEVEADLKQAGFIKWNTGFHFGDEEWRLPAEGRGSVHFMIGKSIYNVVAHTWRTSGSVHGYEYDPGTHLIQHFLHDVIRV